MPPLALVILEIGRAFPWAWPVLGLVLGTVAGSFVSCAAVRLPAGQSLWAPPSHCDSCGTRLGVPDLVPLLSFLVLRGRCRHCGVSYGLHNLLWESLFGILGVLLALAGQPGACTPLVIAAGLVGTVLLVLAACRRP